MSEWTKIRQCKTCGKSFSLSDHGHPGARAAAKELELGDGYDAEADHFAVLECPECAKKTKAEVTRNAIEEVRRKRHKYIEEVRRKHGNKNVIQAVLQFFGLWSAIVAFIYGIFPLGILVFVAGWVTYGSFSDALVFYAAHMGTAFSSIFGLIPIYGNKLHYLLVQNSLVPWAAARGVGPSWLFSTSGLLAGALGAMCPGALFYPIFEKTKGTVPGGVLYAGGVVLVIGTIYSGFLFF